MPALHASAAREVDGKIVLGIANLDPEQAAQVSIHVPHKALQGLTGRVLTASTMQAHNTFEAPNQVRPVAFTGGSFDAGVATVSIPPKSVVVLELN